MTDTLLHCPFCGAKAILEDEEAPEDTSGDRGCVARPQTWWFDSRWKAIIKDWNRRQLSVVVKAKP